MYGSHEPKIINLFIGIPSITILLDTIYFLALAFSGFAIGFIGGMTGLVLGVVRFPVVLSVEPSIDITAGTNLGISTVGAITAAVRHYRQKNIKLYAFIFLGVTGAAGAFIGSFLTSYFPVSLLFLSIGLIVTYESYVLLKGSRNSTSQQKANEIKIKREAPTGENPLPSKN